MSGFSGIARRGMLFASAVCLSAGSAFAAIPLNNWKLTLPVNASGATGGSDAKEDKALTSSTQYPPYFVQNADGSITFSAPTNGATTGGSKYPRSELREMRNGTEAAWTIDQGGILASALAVNELPVASGGKKSRVVIGQIHGPNDELNRLYYEEGGRIYFHDDKAGSGQTETEFPLKSVEGRETAIPLNSRFSYVIKIADNIQTVSVVYNGVTYSAQETISGFWPGQELYFKAGMYLGVSEKSGAGTQGTGRGTATFYNIVLNGNVPDSGLPTSSSTSGGSGSTSSSGSTTSSSSGSTTSSSSGSTTSSSSGSTTSSSSGSTTSSSSGSTTSSSSGSTTGGSSTSSGGQPPVPPPPAPEARPGEAVITGIKVKKSSDDDGNKAENVLDDDLSTRWSAKGKKEYILLDLGSVKKLSSIDIAWYKGDERTAKYTIRVSKDGDDYDDIVKKATTSGSTTDYQNTDLQGVYARYVRIIGYGNSKDKWNSITGVRLYEEKEQ